MPHLHKRRNKLRLASHKKKFTDEELRALEFDFINAYSGTSKSTFKILMRLYMRFPKQLFLSIFWKSFN